MGKKIKFKINKVSVDGDRSLNYHLVEFYFDTPSEYYWRPMSPGGVSLWHELCIVVDWFNSLAEGTGDKVVYKRSGHPDEISFPSVTLPAGLDIAENDGTVFCFDRFGNIVSEKNSRFIADMRIKYYFGQTTIGKFYIKDDTDLGLFLLKWA
jgi:hypothetical protein